MKIGLIDADNINRIGKTFPNLCLMKISAYHKQRGDEVAWYDGNPCDVVYVSKVFSFSQDYDGDIKAKYIVYGGSGFTISVKDGKGIYDKQLDVRLPEAIEHIYPDYSIYGITDTAYGFMTRGCPRKCDFCHVKDMQGTKVRKVANLSEFWNGQKNIVLLDPNITAYSKWKELFQQLIDSKAYVDFSQGIDIRTLTEEKIQMLLKMKIKSIRFAWDRYEDGEYIITKLKMFKEISGFGRNKVSVYVLTNFNTTFEQDLERVMLIRSLNFQPYIMRYDKEHIKRGSNVNALARWCNFNALFWKYETFEEYKKYNRLKVKNNEHVRLG